MRTTNVAYEGGAIYRWITKVDNMKVSCGVSHRIELYSYGSDTALEVLQVISADYESLWTIIVNNEREAW